MNPRIWISFGHVRRYSDVGIDFSLVVFHEVCLGVGEHDFVGGADAGEKCAVNGGRKELRGGFAREEDPVLDGRSYLPAQALLGANRHVGVRAQAEGVLVPSSYEMAHRLRDVLPIHLAEAGHQAFHQLGIVP